MSPTEAINQRSLIKKYGFALFIALVSITTWWITRWLRDETSLHSINRFYMWDNFYHIHHFVIGLFLILIVTDSTMILLWFYRAKLGLSAWILYVLAAVESVGMGMFFDEQDMWLHLKVEDLDKDLDGLISMFIFRTLIISATLGTLKWMHKKKKNGSI